MKWPWSNKRETPPTVDDFANAAAQLDRDSRSGKLSPDEIAEYANKLGKECLGLANNYQAIVNPREEAFLDPSQLLLASRMGISAGFLLVVTAHMPRKMTWGTVLPKDGIKIETPDVDDPVATRHNFGQGLLDYGTQGLRIAGQQTERWLEELEEQTVADVSCRRHYRASAGIIIQLAHQSYPATAALQKQLKELGRGKGDWDKALEEMAPEE